MLYVVFFYQVCIIISKEFIFPYFFLIFVEYIIEVLENMKKITLCFLLLIAGIYNNEALAGIDISVRNFKVNYAPPPSTEPILSCEILAELDGTLIELGLNNIEIIQSNVAVIYNKGIEKPIAGWQKITWGLAIGIPHSVKFEIVVSYNGEMNYRHLADFTDFPGYDIDLYETTSEADHISPPIDLTDILPMAGTLNDIRHPFFFRARWGTNGTTAPYLDSITFTNPNMRYQWLGAPNWDPGSEIPRKLLLDASYLLYLIYEEPPDKPLVRDWMIFHFSGNIQYRLEIVRNSYRLKYKPLLKLKNPTGGEKFAPCEELLIEWSGHNPEFRIKIEYSTDNKKNWNYIANVSGKDTSYLWKVPYILSDSCYIRIGQDFNKTAEKGLVYDSAQILSAEFNDLSTKVLTTSDIGNVVEWDLFTGGEPSVITAMQFPDNNSIKSAIYITDNRFAILDAKYKLLFFMNSTENAVDKTVKLDYILERNLGSLVTDSKRRFILIKPDKHYGNQITFLDTTGKFITSIKENIPITNVTWSDNAEKLYYTLLDKNNTIKEVDLSAFPIIGSEKIYDFAKMYNIIGGMAVSNDDNYIALAVQTIESYQRRPILANNLVYDKQTEKIFLNPQNHDKTAVDIDFSPSDNLLIMANSTGYQLIIEDLTNGINSDRMKQFFDTLLGMRVSKSGECLVLYSKGEFSLQKINCLYISFALPERTENELPFSIVAPSVVLADSSLSKMRNLLIGTTDSVTFALQLCNNGAVNAVFETGYFTNTLNFNLDYSKPPTFPITIPPGECVDFSVICHPQDTGLLNSTLRFVACGHNYNFPFSYRSIDRSLPNVSDTIDFGELCVFERDTLSLLLFTNNDTVDVIINGIYSNNPFFVSYFAPDTLLHPGEKYYAKIYFNPHGIGEHIGRFEIIYCNQWNVRKYIYAKGIGIGTYFDVSHYILPFMPEIPERNISITNTGDATLYIDGVDITPSGYYTCITPLPIYAKIGETIELTIRCNDINNIVPADMRVLAAPCGRSNNVKIVPYQATATLTIPLVETDPRNNICYIPVQLDQIEVHSYQGERFLEFEISMNPSLFLPQYAESDYGIVDINFDKIKAGKRIIEVLFNGNITKNKTEILRIYGVPLLGNTDTSTIEFNNKSPFFGQNVTTTTKDGFFKLTGICDDRFLMTDGYLEFKSATPNPATAFIDIEYEVFGSPKHKAYLNMHDMAGSLLFQTEIESAIGQHKYRLDIKDYTSGAYILIIHYGEKKIISVNIIIGK